MIADRGGRQCMVFPAIRFINLAMAIPRLSRPSRQDNRATLKASESASSVFSTGVFLVHADIAPPPGVAAGDVRAPVILALRPPSCNTTNKFIDPNARIGDRLILRCRCQWPDRIPLTMRRKVMRSRIFQGKRAVDHNERRRIPLPVGGLICTGSPLGSPTAVRGRDA